MKKALLIFLILLLFAVAVPVTAVFYPKFLLSLAVEKMLGARASMEEFSFDFKNNILLIKNFRLYNPPGFGVEATLAEIPEITGKFNPKTLITHRKVHFHTLNIYIKTLAVIKNKEGELNVDKLKIIKLDMDEIPLQVDSFTFSTDDVVYKDYAKGDKPSVEIYNVNIKDRNYENIPSLDEITRKMLMDSLSKTAIKGAVILGVAAVAAGSVAAPVVVPVAAAGILLSVKDTYYANYERNYDDVYKAALAVAKEMAGAVKVNENKGTGIISGKMDEATVTIKVVKESENETHIAVTARKILVAKPRIAGGILYEISDKLREIKPERKKK